LVSLTFDDGPNDSATPLILDVLAASAVRATFFVFGCRASEHPDLIARMVDTGHGVQPHCWAGHDSHHDLRSSSALEEDIGPTLRAIEELGCPTPHFWRPPYGDIKDPESYDVAAANGLQLVTWTLQTHDWKPDCAADRVLGEIDEETREDAILRPDSVVLMHDLPEAPRLVAGLLERINARGYEAGLLSAGNPAIAQGGDYTLGRPSTLHCRGA
jgi:peptidoglycan/xylan/chitin deacetylase (PgdA/CDA1 family)